MRRPHLHQVNAYMTEHEHLTLLRYSATEGRSVSRIIRKLVQGYMLGKATAERRRLEAEKSA